MVYDNFFQVSQCLRNQETYSMKCQYERKLKKKKKPNGHSKATMGKCDEEAPTMLIVKGTQVSDVIYFKMFTVIVIRKSKANTKVKLNTAYQRYFEFSK